ncbi:MAG TPA: hypothetical protein P5063_08195, partial [Methanomassiliicoccales archaeon]|nr:hypothetical protein [Methanomassiliicoccales archaeon]
MRSIIALAAVVLIAQSVRAVAVEVFVSPQGNDRWSGRLAAPNRSRTDGPFATLERARDAVRPFVGREKV